MTVFFLPGIGGLVAASFCGFVLTPVAFSATQFEAKEWAMPHFFIFPPILDLQKMQPFCFVTSWNTVPEERKSLHHFHIFVFLVVHFTAFGVLEHVMNAVSVCITETQSFNCILFTFCIMSLNFHLSKRW